MSATAFNIRPIKPGVDVLSGLSLGDASHQPLKTFLRKHAAKYHQNNYAKTYGAFLDTNPNKAVGYVTLVCGEIAANPKLEGGDDFPYPHYPAVKIARLAVHKDLRGAGIGYQLTVLAIGIIKTQICPHVGCRFIVLDAKQNSMDFYKRQGFTLLDSDENKTREHPIMFLDMTKHP